MFVIYAHIIIRGDEPMTYKNIVSNYNSTKWLKAMKSKIDSMYQNEVRTLVDQPKGIKLMKCK